MIFAPPSLETKLPPAPPGLIRNVDDVGFEWNQPKFKAPRLNIDIPLTSLEELREATRMALKPTE